MSKKRERVLVFDAETLEHFDGFPGYITKSCAHATFEEVLHESKFRLREQVENDPNVKQIIPYVMLRNAAGEILIYKRSPKGNEPRLHNLWSLGVGGHINPGDERDGRDNIVQVAAWREIEEEFKFSPRLENHEKNLVNLGFLYLSDTSVNQVHFGVVMTYNVETHLVSSKSEDIAECIWVPINKLCEYTMEGWSKSLAISDQIK